MSMKKVKINNLARLKSVIDDKSGLSGTIQKVICLFNTVNSNYTENQMKNSLRGGKETQISTLAMTKVGGVKSNRTLQQRKFFEIKIYQTSTFSKIIRFACQSFGQAINVISNNFSSYQRLYEIVRKHSKHIPLPDKTHKVLRMVHYTISYAKKSWLNSDYCVGDIFQPSYQKVFSIRSTKDTSVRICLLGC